MAGGVSERRRHRININIIKNPHVKFELGQLIIVDEGAMLSTEIGWRGDRGRDGKNPTGMISSDLSLSAHMGVGGGGSRRTRTRR